MEKSHYNKKNKMIIEFTVGNFLSFYQKKTISFEAKPISELKENIMIADKHKLLLSLVIYGANSSGKSNLIEAFRRMKQNVFQSVKLNDSDELDYSPFLLSVENESAPTFFEIIFLDTNENTKFRYGFEYNLKKIINEWLYVSYGNKKEIPFFIRTEEGIAVSDKFVEGKNKEEITNDNRLFISLLSQLKGEISQKIMKLFMEYNVISGIGHDSYQLFSLNMFDKKSVGYEESLSFFQTLQLGFEDIIITEKIFDQNNNSDSIIHHIKPILTTKTLKTIHHTYNKKGKIIGKINFDKDKNESEGTKKIIDLSGPIFDTLFYGKSLIIDELDAKLHPLITTHIISLFNNPKTNPKKAQLLFVTHDTNLLSTELFRRDQIWFAQKNKVEQTDLYSLYDFNMPDGNKVRNDSNLEKNYMRGRYEAIPVIIN